MMPKIGRSGAWLLVLLAALTLTASLGTPSHSQARKKLTWSFVDGTNCLDPAFQTGLPDYNNMMPVFNSLVTHKPGTLAEVAPDLAERWTVSPDGIQYTFNLRAGVRWHEGYGEFTAADVKYSFDRMNDPATRARLSPEVAAIQSTDIVDPRTVRVTLKSPMSAFLIRLAHTPSAMIVNRRAVEERGNGHCLRPIGTGPYRVTRAETRGGVSMVAFDEHFKGRPKIDEVEFRVIPDESVAALALRNLTIDFMIVEEPSNILALRKAPGIIVNGNERFSTSFYALWLNNSRRPFNDIRVRRALIHALDRSLLVSGATERLLNRVAHSVIPPSLLGSTDDVVKYEYNPVKARQMLREAGYANGFKTSAISFNTGVYPATLTIVQAMWKRVGVDLEIVFLERAALRQRQAAGDYDINVGNPARPDPGMILDFFHGRNAPPNGIDYSYYRAADNLIDAQAREVDPQKRIEILKRIQQRIATDAPVVPLWYPVQITAARNYVKGIIPNLAWWQTRFEYFDIDH